MIVSKMGDMAMGTCVCAPSPFPAAGIVMTGTSQLITSGTPAAQAGISIVMFPCGTSVIIPSGVSFISGGVPLAKLGDTVVGCGNGVLMGTSTIISL